MDRFLAQPLRKLLGRAAPGLEQAFGYTTNEDLLRHFPRRYLDPATPTDLSGIRLGENVAVMARVAFVEAKPIQARRMTLFTARVTDGTRSLTLTFFFKNQWTVNWYKEAFRVGRIGLFTGTVNAFRGKLQLVHPAVVWVGPNQADPTEAFIEAGKPTPIYPATAKLTSPKLAAQLRLLLDALGQDQASLDAIADPLPEAVRRQHQLPGLGRAFHLIHHPAADGDWQLARHRFRYEEAFVLQVALAQRRRELAAVPAVARPLAQGKDSHLARLDASLPFKLTQAQVEVGQQISALLAQPTPMNQLLQGDVGSGKTVVALRAMVQVVDAGGQAALLAPTEVLAAQHCQTIRQLLGQPGPKLGQLDLDGLGQDQDQAQPGQPPDQHVDAAAVPNPALAGQAPSRGHAGDIGVRLLTGSLTPKAKAAVLADMASGRAGLVVGTHALLQEAVSFRDLGLVVVDEQHRFGVEQRDALRARADIAPHLLIMTATPIPRTVAMTVFGDLGVLVLGQAPPGRSPVSTVWVNPATHPAWLTRVWERVAEEVAAGHRAFVVCPAIEPGQVEEGTELVDDAAWEEGQPGAQGALAFPEPGAPPPRVVRPPVSVAETLTKLQATPCLRGARLGVMHGRLSAEQKDRTMAAFAAGQLDVLVATTVIEVGIDIPEATALVVLDAERFGLSQLHQLRGRVGRGADPGVCLLVSDADPDTVAARRLEALVATTDGFQLAEVDLETRHEGDILGAAQSGHSSTLRLLRVTKDAALIAQAREAAEALVQVDPGLSRHPALAAALERAVGERQDFLERG